MDYLKTRAPFWKREHLADGTIGAWVDAKERGRCRRGALGRGVILPQQTGSGR